MKSKSGKTISLNQAFNMDCLDFMKELPNKSVGLIMADPPYFEVKGDFDFVWSSFDDYLKDVEKWAIECKRILADNGSLFWWGHAKKIAYSQIILDKYFNLGNNMKWEKAECQTMIGSDNYRSFMPVTEHCLFYSNDFDENILKGESGNCFFQPVVEKLISEKNGMTNTELSILSGIKESQIAHYFRKDHNGWRLPSQAVLDLLDFKLNENELLIEYEMLKEKYFEPLRRPFNNINKLTDVIKHSQESHISKNYDHDTIKPLGLIKKLLQTTTRKDTIVYIPFWGSGTDSEACHELGLNWIATETNEKHFKNASERQKEKERQPLMEF